MKQRAAIGHLAAAGTYIIFGVNIVFCRDITTESGVAPIVLFAMRAFFSGILFWLLSLVMPRERVERKDLLKLFGAAVIGIFLPQLTFLNAIARTTPVDLSIITTITPILTMFFAALFLREPITWKKAGGVLLSFVGVVWVILQSDAHGGGALATTPLGIVYCVLNCTIFALYLGTCRPLMKRYSVVTSMKWIFLFSFLLSVPFTLRPLTATDFGAVSGELWWKIAFLIFFATFVAYFLLPVGQALIRPTLVSMYGYLQPIIAIAIAIVTGGDQLTWTKLVAALLVFVGVWVVSTSKKAENQKEESLIRME